MKFRKVPQEHEDLLAAVAKSFPELQARRMFGCPAWFLKGHLVAGAHQEAIFVRLSERDREAELAKPGVTAFAPMPGRVMREYVALPVSALSSPEELKRLIGRAVLCASALPPKQPRVRSRRGRGR
jgi:TfoX/Sxy family transcriptional regulator of competence genes